MTTSYSIMAHPKRRDQAEQLAQRAFIPESAIVWDRHDDEWDTGSRALGNHWGTWHCVLQDDALPIADLRTHVEDAIRHAPERTCISLYTGTARPLADRVTLAMVQADGRGASWLTHDTLLWGVSIVLPSEDIAPLLAWAERKQQKYDRRIGDWYREQGRTVYYTWPSLVDHADSGSLLAGHDRGTERRAHRVGIPAWNTRSIPI